MNDFFFKWKQSILDIFKGVDVDYCLFKWESYNFAEPKWYFLLKLTTTITPVWQNVFLEMQLQLVQQWRIVDELSVSYIHWAVVKEDLTVPSRESGLLHDIVCYVGDILMDVLK